MANRKDSEQQYVVTASNVTPGHMQGTVLPASAFGDRLEKHLRTGAVREADPETEAQEPEPEPERHESE